MQAGKLKHRITIQRMEQSQNQETGDIIIIWGDLATIWARVVDVSGQEFIQSAATQAKVTTRINIRYRDITAKDRILFRGRLYNIHAVLSDNESGLEYINLMCSEGVNDGGG